MVEAAGIEPRQTASLREAGDDGDEEFLRCPQRCPQALYERAGRAQPAAYVLYSERAGATQVNY